MAIARARDRDPSYSSTATNKCCQVTNIGQATRHATPSVDLERGIYAAAQYQYLRRSGQNVSQRSARVPWETPNQQAKLLNHETDNHPSANTTRLRFVFSPTTEVDRRLTAETTDLKTDVENLNKKLHYLETTHKNSREHIAQIFKSGGRA